jgi:hypothetical protein
MALEATITPRNLRRWLVEAEAGDHEAIGRLYTFIVNHPQEAQRHAARNPALAAMIAELDTPPR